MNPTPTTETREKKVQIQQIWVPCAEGKGQARLDNQNLMLAAIIAGSKPIYLAKDVVWEEIFKTKESITLPN